MDKPVERFVRLTEAVTLLLVAGLLVGQALGTPLVLGFVETGSMRPTMQPGDGFVAVPPVVTGGVDEGDVITFRSETIGDGRLTTHRVVDVTSEGYVTRGDANPFTDQQSGEPSVSRDRVVSEALQVGGTVVVIPGLGDAVRTVRSLVESVGDVVGLGVTQVFAFLFVCLVTLYLLDRNVDDRRRRERLRDTSRGVSGTKLVGFAVVGVVLAATLSMTVGSGVIAVQYDSVDPGTTDKRGITTGETADVSIELRNGGVVPMTTVLRSPDPNTELAERELTIGPREARSVNLSISAPSSTGRHETRIERRQYVPVLPTETLVDLSDRGHLWAVAAVDSVLGVIVGVLGLVTVGRGRLRVDSGQKRPLWVDIRRAVRSLYR